MLESFGKIFDGKALRAGPWKSMTSFMDTHLDNGDPLVRVGPQSSIALSYKIESEDEIFEAFGEENPAIVKMGTETLSPFLQNFLIGKKLGDDFHFDFAASLLFGPYNLKLRFQMAHNKLPEKFRNLEIDDAFESFGPDRNKHLFRVVEKNEKNMTFDGNRFPEGTYLKFVGKVLKIYS